MVIDLPRAGDDEIDVVSDPDLAERDEDIEAHQALAFEWCLDPTKGLETVLATGAVHLEAVTVELIGARPEPLSGELVGAARAARRPLAA